MKRIILSLIMMGVISGGTAMAQRIKSALVPGTVTDALKKKYPEASKVTWEKEKGNFEANWGGKSGEDMSVQFSQDGTFIEQVKAISIKELPAGIFEYVKAHYNGAKISEAGKVTDAKGATMYEVEIKGKDVIFDAKGNFMKPED